MKKRSKTRFTRKVEANNVRVYARFLVHTCMHDVLRTKAKLQLAAVEVVGGFRLVQIVVDWYVS